MACGRHRCRKTTKRPDEMEGALGSALSLPRSHDDSHGRIYPPWDVVASLGYTLPVLAAGRASPQPAQLAGGCQFKRPGFSGIASGLG
jgi:hypothetical protein